MTDINTDIAVIGGGVSGLTAAWHLKRLGIDVALIEAQSVVGGAVQTERRDGFLFEKGPFNVIVRDPAFEELLDGLADRIRVVTADSRAKNRYIYRHGYLHRVPTNPVGLLRSPLLSLGGACRAMRGLLVSTRGTAPDCTLDEFATRRFGKEVADTLVSAAIAGILAGDISKLSAYDCFPVLRDFDQKSLSPIGRTLRRMPTILRKRFNPKLGRRWKGLVSIDVGLGGMCQAVADELGDNVYTDTRVDRLVVNGAGCTLDAGERQFRAKRVILATPIAEATRLLAPMAPEVCDVSRDIASASLVVANVVIRRDYVKHPLDGFGFLTPRNEPSFPLMGVLWADSAFPHHAPHEFHVLRLFFGGDRTPDATQRPADELVQSGLDALRDLLGIIGEPTSVDVSVYPEAIPQYFIGHAAKAARLREIAGRLPGVHLAGNYLEGVSINDCVKVGKRVAFEAAGATPGV